VQSAPELQERFARAVTTGKGEPIVAQLLGGADPGKRLSIHLRHYEASLTTVLRDSFPACAWLAGPDLVSSAAHAFARAHPPLQPCLAEYGSDFPQFLSTYGRAAALPYLEPFANLEWAVGQASIAIEHPPLAWPDLAAVGPAPLVDLTLSLQPGLRYLRAAWRVDELMTLYLGGAEPESFVLAESDTCIEVRGERGNLRLARLEGPVFVFRAQLAAGQSIGDAATRALENDSTFDAGNALRRLAEAGLVSSTSALPEEPA